MLFHALDLITCTNVLGARIPIPTVNSTDVFALAPSHVPPEEACQVLSELRASCSQGRG